MFDFHTYLQRIAESRILNEMKKNITDQLTSWLEENPEAIGFDNIFGDKKRLVVPFISDDMLYLKNKIERIPDKNYKVDLARGMVSMPVKTQRGVQIREMRLGRFLHNLSPEDQQLWANAGAYSIVVSRAPIDVVRMSDFKNIQSCHSQGGMFFHCAVAEAKGNGPIAYVVRTQDLSKINLDDDEVFADPDRGVKGIVPISRIRVRKFIPKTNDEGDNTGALAIPEAPVYGDEQIGDAFHSSLRNFLFEKQQDILGGGRPEMKNYERVGGSYVNAGEQSGDWWNDFFQDTADKGDAKYRRGDDEEESREDQYEREIAAIKKANANTLTSGHVWCDASVEMSDGRAYVSVNGDVMVTLPGESFIKEVGHQEAWQLRKSISDALSHKPLYLYGVDNVEIGKAYKGSEIEVRLYLSSEGQGVPEDLNDMYEMCKDWDKKMPQVHNAIYHVLWQAGYVQEPYHHKWDEQEPTWQHFKLDDSEGYTEIMTNTALGNAGYDLNDAGIISKVFPPQKKKQFEDSLTNIWRQEILRAQNIAKQQPMFPGWEDEPPAVENFPLPDVEASVGHAKYGEADQFFVVVSFKFPGSVPHAKGQLMEKVITYLDKRWNQIVPMMVQTLQTVVGRK